jgi:hypothetical protein
MRKPVNPNTQESNIHSNRSKNMTDKLNEMKASIVGVILFHGVIFRY